MKLTFTTNELLTIIDALQDRLDTATEALGYFTDQDTYTKDLEEEIETTNRILSQIINAQPPYEVEIHQ